MFHARADWVRLVEALYAPVDDERAWGAAVVDAFRSAYPRDDNGGAALVRVEHDAEHTSRRLSVVFGIGRAAGFDSDDVDPLSREMFAATFYSPRLALTSTEVVRSAGRARRVLDGMRARWGYADALGIVAHPEPGIIAFLSRPLRAARTLTQHERRVLSRVALHLASAYRLRRRPESVLAVLTPDGRVVHREGADLEGARLEARVRRIESSRARAPRRSPDALELWNALVDGRASVVERFDGGKRYYFVLENAPSHRTHRALTRREIEIVRLAARGLPAKLVGYALGLSPPKISDDLASAATKLGLATRLRLLDVAARLLDTPHAPVETDTLTDAERDIFELVRMGLSNADIAARRARSTHTVANQVAAILRKTQRPTRRALVSAKRS